MKAHTILVVDDDAPVLPFLARTLKRAGFSVLTADDGALVPEMLSSKRVDLVLLDLHMPGMTGWEVLRALRDPLRLPGGGPRPKVIVMSGRDEDEAAGFVRKLGAEAYLMKPLWPDTLLATIRRVLDDVSQPVPLPPV